MDKSLLDRLNRLEHRSADNRDVRDWSNEELEAYVFDMLGYTPTLADLERITAGEAAVAPKE